MLNSLSIALKKAHTLVDQKGGKHVLHTSELNRKERELLIRHKWLKEIIRGWYLFVPPTLTDGESSVWYSSFWDFLSLYLDHHYKKNYCLSAELSIQLHTQNFTVPHQVIVIGKKGANHPVALPHETSLLVYADPKRLPREMEQIHGLNVMSLAFALCKATPTFFELSPKEAEIALRIVKDPHVLTRVIVEYGFEIAAGRLIGGYRFLGETQIADQIRDNVASAGMRVLEVNPFKKDIPLLLKTKKASPFSMRLRVIWSEGRQSVVELFDPPPGLPKNTTHYLNSIRHLNTEDAYNSLSIEGYRVDKQLIEQVAKGMWNPHLNSDDSREKDALAAKGYFLAFQEVQKTIQKILKKSNPAQVVSKDLSLWYQSLFMPSAEAGLFPKQDLFGYRKGPVFIRNSRHTPPSKDVLIDAMETFFELLMEEEHPAVRAVLGHFLFVYIHPYPDGNGRIARFLMNAMFASGGYPWTVILVAQRDKYIASLEQASVEGNLKPFALFIKKMMRNTLA